MTDGGAPDCPNCDSDDVLDADDALEAYRQEADETHPKAVFAYEMADFACSEPECATLWGEEFDRPLTMQEVMEA